MILLFRSLSMVLASPTISMSGSIILFISDGSMSMWMILALAQNLSAWPMMRSSNLEPMLMRRSHSQTALFAYAVPCIPSIPRFRGCISEMIPLPKRVLVSGQSRVVENWSISS